MPDNQLTPFAALSDETRARLITAALDAQRNAYVPYSHYPVGAALLSTDGHIFTGCNVENASFGGTICAERTALVKAVSEGAREFVAIAVITSNGASPCGICRQVLNEFAPNLAVIAADAQGQMIYQITLADLLPRSFGPQQLDEGVARNDHGTS